MSRITCDLQYFRTFFDDPGGKLIPPVRSPAGWTATAAAADKATAASGSAAAAVAAASGSAAAAAAVAAASGSAAAAGAVAAASGSAAAAAVAAAAFGDHAAGARSPGRSWERARRRGATRRVHPRR